jgi:hypothetical protein
MADDRGWLHTSGPQQFRQPDADRKHSRCDYVHALELARAGASL